jgi:hypothetical protein
VQFLGILAVVVALFLLVSAYPTAAVIIGAATVLTILAFRLRVRRPAARVSAPSPAQRYQRIKSFGTSDLRATDDDRELTTDVLTGALRNGSLTVAEYSDRCGTAGAAHLRQQLFTCVRDLDF